VVFLSQRFKKSTNNFEKNHKQKLYGEHYSNSQYFKEKNYKTKFLTNSILKNIINKDNF